jgi:hypothetical protein
MSRILWIAFGHFLVVWSLAAAAHVTIPAAAAAQGRRVALVVGVAKYEHADTLTNTINDAVDIGYCWRTLSLYLSAP